MSLPLINHCLICEDIRIEHRNLVSLMGVYGMTPYVGIRIRNFKLHVAFCSVFYGPPSEGKFDIKVELRSPNGTKIEANVFPEHSELTFSEDLPVIIGFKINALFPIPETYTLILSGNGVEIFKDTLKIVQADESDFS